MEAFGKHIRQLRLTAQLELSEVAQAVELSISALEAIERSEQLAPQNIIEPLANVLNCDYRKLQIQYLSDKLFQQLRLVDYATEALTITKKRLELTRNGIPPEGEKHQIIEKINTYLQKKPVDKAWLFGSFARNQQHADSDLDIIVRFEQPNKLNLFDYVGISQDLEDLTGRKVDLVQEGFIRPIAQKNVEQEKVLIYERKAG